MSEETKKVVKIVAICLLVADCLRQSGKMQLPLIGEVPSFNLSSLGAK